MDDPLDYIDFADILQAWRSGKMEVQGTEAGKPHTGHFAKRLQGTMKHYDQDDEFGDEIEVHYFRHPDGSVADVKIKLKS